MTRKNIMRIPLMLVLALALAFSMLSIPTKADAAVAPSPALTNSIMGYAAPVTCVHTQVSARTRIAQTVAPFQKKNFYVDVIQGYKVCNNRLGADYIKPTWYRYRYDVEGNKVRCSGAMGTGLKAVKFRTHFYDIRGRHVKYMPTIGISCDNDGTKSYYGRWNRSAPSLNWRNSSAAGSPEFKVTVGINWNIPAGSYNGYGVMGNQLYAKRM